MRVIYLHSVGKDYIVYGCLYEITVAFIYYYLEVLIECN